MDIKRRNSEKAAIFDLKGPLKMGDPVDQFREAVQEALDGGAKNLAINLAHVPEMDSSGMGVLVRVFTAVSRQGGKCRFFGAPKKTLQFLKMVRLDTVLELVEDEAAALRGL